MPENKFRELGIPEYEITPAISIAVSGLLAKIEHLDAELNQTRLNLEGLQNMIDEEGDVTLPSRKAFIKRLEWSIAMFKRHQGKTCVVVFRMADYDGIERLYGTAAVNRAVKLIAEYISTSIRDTDYFARLGKDEFGGLLYFGEYENITKKAEEIAMKLRGMPMSWNNSVVNFGISVGVHMVESADSAESAVLAASNASFVFEEKKKFEEINFKA